MLPKLLLPAVIGILCLLTTTTSATKTLTTVPAAATTTTAVSKPLHNAETTTSLLPLQPPLNLTSTTTSSFVSEQTKHSITAADNVVVKNDSLSSDSMNEGIKFQTDKQASGIYHVQLSVGNAQTGHQPLVRYDNQNSTSEHLAHAQELIPPKKLNKTELKLGSNSQGYINFELNYDDQAPEEKVQKRKTKKTETVNEVLSSLFPNGFSDIFRFSYASEPSTETTSMHTPTTSLPLTMSMTSIKPNSKQPPENQTYYSYQTSVSKEYRRETRPGHTEIVVEKLQLTPKSSSDEFKDGSNLITKDDLLRINRAAVEASVLPSLLMKPTSINSSKELTLQTVNVPIVILNENSDELEETREDDNQIAESQQVRHIYQRLPETIHEYPYKNDGGTYKSNTLLQEQKQEINVQIIHDDRLKETADAGKYTQKLFTPAAELSEQQTSPQADNVYPREERVSHELDQFQEHAEKNFQQRNIVQEAPSRNFLKHFNPVLTEGDNGPISKGNFHYEVNTPQSTTEYTDNYARPAAQLVHHYETHHTPQDQQLNKAQRINENSEYNEQQQQIHHEEHPEQIYDISEYRQEHQHQLKQPQEISIVSKIHHEQQQHQHKLSQQQKADHTSELHTHIHHSQPVTATNSYQESIPSSSQYDLATPSGAVFVTVNTPSPQSRFSDSSLLSLPSSKHSKSPHNYVVEGATTIQQNSQTQHDALYATDDQALQAHPLHEEIGDLNHPQKDVSLSEATAAASQKQPQHEAPPEANSKPMSGYTYVEVQKSINIHNKLITERDGQLVEQHETIYPQPQYGERLYAPISQKQQHPAKEYVSLSTNPIHVQHIEYEGEHQEESASHDALQHVPSPSSEIKSQPHINYVEQLVPQPYPVVVEKIVERPYPVTQIVEAKVPQPYPVKEVIEKVVDRHVPIEKIIDRPVKVPYPVHIDHFIDRPYPVKEIVEKHIHVPYPVPEPVPVPVHVDHFYERPYPVETIVEKPVPYAVERVVEKVVEKHVPVEIERIVEKQVERFVEKFVDRPIAIPIHVPVAMPVPMIYGSHASQFSPTLSGHPNALSGWGQQVSSVPQSTIPPKVLQNYYTRMLKKLLPQMTTLKVKKPSTTATKAFSTAPKTSAMPSKFNKSPSSTSASQTTKPTFKITDIRFDLKPPPPSGVSWSQGARYIYNTLPLDLATSAASAPAAHSLNLYQGPVSPSVNEPYDEFQRWRNGHSLKRSPELGRNLHVEYGFKPPLVPSLEIDDHGVPLNSGIARGDE